MAQRTNSGRNIAVATLASVPTRYTSANVLSSFSFSYRAMLFAATTNAIASYCPNRVSTPTIARSSIPIARPELAASFLNPSGKAASLRREPSSNLTNNHAGTMQRASEVVHTSVSAQYGESSLEAFFAKNTPATTQQPTCRAWSSRKACTSP